MNAPFLFLQIVTALQQCIYYLESCDAIRERTLEITHAMEHQQIGMCMDSRKKITTCMVYISYTF